MSQNVLVTCQSCGYPTTDCHCRDIEHLESMRAIGKFNMPAKERICENCDEPSSTPFHKYCDDCLDLPHNVPKANDRQHGGDHYKQLPIQPWDYIVSNNLGFLEGNAVKYLTRHREKNGVEDLRKAIHYIEKLIEVELARKEID